MAQFAKTVTIATTDTEVTFPADLYADKAYKLRNLDSANGVWVRIKDDDAAAVAEADETEYLGPGESMLIPHMKQCHMIAITASVKVNIVASIGRAV